MELNNYFSRTSVITLFIAVTIVLGMSSCHDDPLNLDRIILPPQDTFEVYIDTFPAEIFTIEANPVYANTMGYSPMGTINDPIFGKLKAGFLTDITFPDDFEYRSEDSTEITNVEIHDLELKLVFKQYYGDEDTMNIDFNVYELLEKVPDYEFSDYEVQPGMYDPVPLNISEPELGYDYTTDSDGDVTDTVPYVSVKLSNDYARKLLDYQMVKDSAYFYDSIFREFLYGLYIETEFRDNEGGSIFRVNQHSSNLILRTVKEEDDTTTILDHDFILADPGLTYPGKSLNLFDGEFSPQISSAIGDTTTIHDKVYLQSLVGPRSVIKFPTLKQFKNDIGYSYIVNKAELVLPVNETDLDLEYYSAPTYLGVHDVVNDTTILDDGFTTGLFGGYLNTDEMEYRLQVGNQMHDYLRDASNTAGDQLYLFSANLFNISDTRTINYYSLTAPGRVVLNNANSDKAPYLRIIYSVIP